jgi:hypothetical protein
MKQKEKDFKEHSMLLRLPSMRRNQSSPLLKMTTVNWRPISKLMRKREMTQN